VGKTHVTNITIKESSIYAVLQFSNSYHRDMQRRSKVTKRSRGYSLYSQVTSVRENVQYRTSYYNSKRFRTSQDICLGRFLRYLSMELLKDWHNNDKIMLAKVIRRSGFIEGGIELTDEIELKSDDASHLSTTIEFINCSI